MDQRRRKPTTSRIPDVLAIDMLSRLPSKSLVRFRCVSKSWNSLIRAPNFVELHHSRSSNRQGGRGLIITFKHQQSKLCLMLTGYQGKPARHSLFTSKYDRFSPVINCLICLIGNNLVSICNICTHELIHLPASNLQLQLGSADPAPSYLFGYHPETKEYKVLKIWTIEKPNGKFSREFEVFTLRTFSWKRVRHPVYEFSSPFFSHNEYVCANGVIYWIQRPEDYRRKFVEFFDLKHEKFHRTMFPSDALEGATNLIEVQGQLAIASWPNIRSDSFEITMWIFQGNNRSSPWRQEKIIVPRKLTGIKCPYPAGTIRSGEILLMDNFLLSSSRLVFYDCKTKSFKGSAVYTHFLHYLESPVVAKKWSRFSHYDFKEIYGDDFLRLSVTDYVENILPLK